jgi:septation ring formation regulator EzrA
MEYNTNNLTPEEILDLLMDNLSECNRLVATLGKKARLDREELRKLRNDLMFARSKARHLAQALEEMKKPINAFKLSSI